jgi:hypothetical protein
MHVIRTHLLRMLGHQRSVILLRGCLAIDGLHVHWLLILRGLALKMRAVPHTICAFIVRHRHAMLMFWHGHTLLPDYLEVL